jgi:uncharacterized delta-60 repeat protein
MKAKFLIFACSAVVRLISVAECSKAQSGTLDASFGTGGKLTTDLGLTNYAYSTIVQPDGKILVGGNIANGYPNYGDFLLVRYNADGTPDNSFGVNSIVTTNFSANSNEGITSIALQADGKIVAAGSSGPFNSGRDYQFAIARYNANGTLDANFGSGGKTTTNIGDYEDNASALVIQPDGKIILGGTTENAGAYNSIALTRYNTDGTLDNTFGNAGLVITVAGAANGSSISSIALQPNGKILAFGNVNDVSVNDDFIVVRYKPTGAVDKSFGTSGITTTDLGSAADYAASIMTLPNGKILVGGSTNNLSITNQDFALVRYNSNGIIDNSFGNGGIVKSDLGSTTERPYSMLLQADGKILMGGIYYTGNDGDFVLARYTTSGALDNDFGSAGKTITSFGTSGDWIQSLALQSDGKIVAAGVRQDSRVSFAIARYTNHIDCIDVYENNNSMSRARAIAANTTLNALINSATDKDWFSFSNTASSPNIQIDLTRLPVDYNLFLYDPTGIQVASSTHHGTSSEHIIYTTAVTGIYKINIKGKSGAFDASNCYTLTTTISNSALPVSKNERITSQSSKIISVNSAALEQNIPNPFNNATTINYTLPQKYSSAKIIITDQSGKILKQVNISGNGKGSLKIDASTLMSGAYSYSLYVDGNFVGSKQMILSK